MNLIGDIAGHYETLMALLKQMPDDEPVSIGDMIDRGPKSKEVVEFFMKNGRAVLGNHEHMLLCGMNALPDIYRNGFHVWMGNGGHATLSSFMGSDAARTELPKIPEDVINWLKCLPLFLKEDGLFVSHAPVSPYVTFEKCISLSGRGLDDSIIWNRFDPPKMEGYYQVFGHNSYMGGEKIGEPDYALCIDNSQKKILMGLHTPTMRIYEQPFID